TAHEVGDQARQAGSGLIGTIRNNPIPSAMIGAGIAWLIAGRRRRSHESERSSESYGGYYSPQPYTSADTAMYGPPAGTVGATSGGGIRSSPRADYDTSGMDHEEHRGMGDKAAALRDRVSDSTSHARERVSAKASHARERVAET